MISGYSRNYAAVIKPVLKIISKSKKNLLRIKDFNKIEQNMKKISNTQLKNSLNNLLKAYNEKNE